MLYAAWSYAGSFKIQYLKIPTTTKTTILLSISSTLGVYLGQTLS